MAAADTLPASVPANRRNFLATVRRRSSNSSAARTKPSKTKT